MVTIRMAHRELKLRSIAGFSAPLLLACGSFLPVASAQQPEAASSPAPAVAPAASVLKNPIPNDQLAFLIAYAGRPAKDLLKDKRFHALLKLTIPHSGFHYGKDMPLDEASDMVLSGSKIPVQIREDRYVLISGKQGPYLHGMGFVWFDLQTGIALGGFYFHPVNGEPTPTLAIFSKQLQDHSLGMSQMPLAFAEDLSQWVATSGARWVSPRYFIPENGKKYVLLHDEDFCDHPANAPAPPADTCQQLNAEAAEADMDAAYFMAINNNEANAVVWGLVGRQLATWVELRNQSCNVGPDKLGCRVRMTREHTRMILQEHSTGRRS